MLHRLAIPLSIALCAAVPAAAQLTVPQVAQRAGPAVVSIRKFDAAGREQGLGSGFLLRDGRIVTNAHVVEGGARVEVFDFQGRLLGSAQYAEAYSGTVDLAILPRMGAAPVGLSLARSTPPVGEQVVAIGAPEGLTNTVTEGIVSAFREMDGQMLMQISAPLSSGSSGGPVLNRRGEVVGVSVAVLTEGQNLNFAVPLADLQAMVSSPPGRVPFPGEEVMGRGPALATGGGEITDLAIGQAVLGALEDGDHVWSDGSGWFDLYSFQARAGQRLSITARSREFDTYLRIARVNANDELDYVDEDDDGAGGTDARVSVTAPATGEYVIAVSAYEGDGGGYSLSLMEDGSGPVAAAPYSGVPAPGPDDPRWLPAGEGESFDRWFDITRIDDLGNGIYRVWVRSIYHQAETDEYGTTYDNTMSLMDQDCGRRRWRPVQFIQYLGGRSVWSSEEEEGDWESWIPDTVGEATGQAICAYVR